MHPSGIPRSNPILSPNAPTFLPSDGPISTPNLSDMEAQRRQELQARKAASTSHRHKGANAPAEGAREPSPSVNGALGISSIEPLQLAPSDAVDTFLNNMEDFGSFWCFYWFWTRQVCGPNA